VSESFLLVRGQPLIFVVSFSFHSIGNELTPSAKYDFKFKDYAPWVFRELREYFHLDPADYLLSLTAKYILSELGSPGKSGSFFYFSRDYRFIIKTIRHSEHKFLLNILKDYHEHVKANPHTLLSRFYGLHRVKLPRGRKIHFVIMNNLFPPHRDIHETYDLKGSIIGREYPEEKAAQKKGAVMKDINWLRRNRKIELGPEKRALFEAQLKSDVELLKRLNIMDYSLLIGLHDMHRGNREGLRQEKLQVFQPETGSKAPLKREPSSKNKRLAQKDASALRAAVRREGPKSLTSDLQLPTQDFSERRNFFFYQDEGGFRSTNENDEPTSMIYYLGVIDLFTPYTSVKRGETWWKGMTQDRHMISSVPPKEYGERFFKFMMMCANKAATWPNWKDKAKPLTIDISANGEPQHGLEKSQDPQSTAANEQQETKRETISEKPEKA
jgi:1-phosphatidylinositol-4-phosphate 5-kinase